LDHIQGRVESVLPFSSSNLEQIATWQRVLHTQSSKKVQEYLNTNLEQIAKVIFFPIVRIFDYTPTSLYTVRRGRFEHRIFLYF
jgi:hypothetical protein